MIIVGHSAGAHLAAMVGIDHLRLREAGANPEQIESVCLIDGASYHLPDAMKNAKPLLRRIYETAFTNSIENQTDASPLLKPFNMHSNKLGPSLDLQRSLTKRIARLMKTLERKEILPH